MSTVLVQIEAVVNSRPLCYVADDVGDTAITPSHLIHGRRLLDISPSAVTKDVACVDRFRHKQAVLDAFWKKFQTDYLLQLRDHQRSTKQSLFPSDGDAVLMSEKHASRSVWPRAIVDRLFRSKEDGTVQGVELRFPDGTVLKRPVNHVFPTEIDLRAPIEPVVESDSGKIARSKRAAAKTGELIRQLRC